MIKIEIIMEPHSGEEIGECFRRAARICLDEDCKVSFVHNDRKYFIGPEHIRRAFDGYLELEKEMRASR